MIATTHPKRPVVLTAVIAALAVLAAVLPGTVAQAAGTSVISGRVIQSGSTGFGAGEVDVYYQRLIATNTWGPETFGSTTNANGDYRISGLDQGNYRLRLDYTGPNPNVLDGWLGTGGAQVQYEDTNAFIENAGLISASRTGLDIQLSQRTAAHGYVRLSGRGVTDRAKVTATYLDPTTSTWVEAGSSLTDETGRYVIRDLINVGYKISVEYLGDEPYLPSTWPSAAKGGYPTYHDFTLNYDNRLSGRVFLDDEHTPAGAGTVSVTIREGGHGAGTVQLVDHEGRYSFATLPRSGYTVHFTYLGTDGPYRTSYRWVSLYEAQVVLDYVMERPASISGRALGDAGVPLAGVTVRATNDGSLLNPLTDVTDANGEYSFTDLASGFWELHFDDGAGPYASVWWDDVNPYYSGGGLDLAPGEDATGIDALLRREARLSGSVTGAGLSGADYASMYVEVMVYDYAEEAWVDTEDSYPVTSSGTYSIPDLYPGSYRLHAVYYGAKGWRQTISGTVTLAAGTSRSLSLSLPSQGNSPINVELPRVVGGTTPGDEWRVELGSWVSLGTLAVAWLRCDAPVTVTFSAVPPGCVAISGANRVTYFSTYADGGKYLTAQVAGINPAGTTLVGATNSSQMKPSIPPTMVGPAAVHVVGDTYYASAYSWTSVPSLTYSVVVWLRCSSPVTAQFTLAPQGCTVIPGASNSSYVATVADAGKYLTFQMALGNGGPTTFVGAPNTIPVPSLLPTYTVAPSVSGPATLGSTWTLDTGTWSGSPTFIQAWLRCTHPVPTTFGSVPDGCVAIAGARSTTYTTTSADAGKYITAQVAATNSHGTTLSGAASTTALPGPPPPTAPANTVAPTVSGTAAVGSTWTVNTGTWTGTPTPTIIQAWLRCTSPVAATWSTIPAGCTAIPGARGTTYVTTTADAGRYLIAQVAGTNTVGSVFTGTANTVQIPGPPPPTAPVNSVAPTMSGGTSIGSTWTLNPGTWTGYPAPTYIQAWLRCTAPVTATWTAIPAGCVAIPGARGTTYVTTAADAGKYLVAQVGAVNSVATVLTGTAGTTQLQGPPPASAPVNTVAPTVSGGSSAGSTWIVIPGTWTGNPTPTIVQAWLRCTGPVEAGWATIPAGCTAIPGARGLVYVSTTADAGKYLTAQVAGINSVGTVFTGAANSVQMTGPAPASAPVNTVLPTVEGAAAVGSTWTLLPGTWSGNPTPTVVQAWLRCTGPVEAGWATIPAGCTAIPGARGLTYVSTSADVGRFLVAQVGGINSVGTTLTGSASTVPTGVSG